eukprot:3399993-Pleurochrysis_carterae.AAC.1
MISTTAPSSSNASATLTYTFGSGGSAHAPFISPESGVIPLSMTSASSSAPIRPASLVSGSGISCRWASQGDDTSSAPTMPRPENPRTVDRPSAWPSSPPVIRFDRLALIALGSGDPRTLARRPECA